MTEIESLQATRVAHHLVLTALIQTHPRFADFQLLLTSLLEQQLGGGSLGTGLSEAQREAVRYTVEWTQAIQPASGRLAPWTPPR